MKGNLIKTEMNVNNEKNKCYENWKRRIYFIN